MFEFRMFHAVAIFALIVIFVAMFFIHYMLNNFFFMTSMCASAPEARCGESSMNMLLVFTFLIVMSFIVLIESTIYFIFKEVEVEMLASLAGSRKAARTAKELIERKDEIKKSKKDIRKKYFKREMEEKAYKSMKESLDKELMEVESDLRKLNLLKK